MADQQASLPLRPPLEKPAASGLGYGLCALSDIFTSRRRLLLAALLFCGWIGWMGYLVVRTSLRPAILSRPQFLVSEIDLIAEVHAGSDGQPDPLVVVDEVYWTQKETGPFPKNLTIVNLPQCEGWNKPGRYILPLVKEEETYRVPSIPLSPGFNIHNDRPRIYPFAPQTLDQLEAIRGRK